MKNNNHLSGTMPNTSDWPAEPTGDAQLDADTRYGLNEPVLFLFPV